MSASRTIPSVVQVAAVLWVGAASGCSGAQLERLDAEVNRQREEIADLRRNQAAQRVQFDEFRNRLVVLQDNLESERIAAQRAGAGRAGVAAEAMPSLQRVVVEAPSTAPSTPAPSEPAGPAKTVVIGPDGVPHVQGEAPGAARAAPSRAGAKAAGPRPSANDAPPQDGNTPEEAAAAAYRDAKSLLDAGQLEAARAGFEAFLQAHPSHTLADNALYWIGETWYAKALWLKAARVFGEVVQRFPRGNKVPDAMVKTALCYKNLGETALATDVLRQLIRLYPSTSAAELARDQLSRLEAKP